MTNQQKTCCGNINKPVSHVDDLDQRASKKNYSSEEATLRKKLASFYRLVDLLGWSEGIYNHITCRLPGDKERFLINPFGFFYHEVTASSLLTVELDGTVADQGATNFGINDRAYVLHSAVHAARPDVQCVVHLHTPEVIAISSIKRGFLALSQEACFLGDVMDYDFRGTLVDLNERQCLVDTLGEKNAFLCNVPVDALIRPSREASIKSYEALINGEVSGTDSKGRSVHWPQGELDWEAWMRLLDGMGMKTGHNYRLQQWK